MQEYKRIIIIGAGLMGASLINQLKKHNISREIIALVRNEQQIKQLLENNIEADINYNICSEADIIFIATPLSTYEDIFKKLANLSLKKDVIISDLGSVKEKPIKLAKTYLTNINFVATHPIAGSHLSGAGTIIEDLYQNKKLIISRETENNANIIANIWKTIGMKLEYLDANKHDEIYAYISHLVQKIAFNLDKLFVPDLKTIKNQLNSPIFNKFTRLCDSRETMWNDIFLFNEKHLNIAINKFLTNLELIIKTNNFPTNKTLNIRLAQIISTALLNTIPKDYLNYAGSGFKDITEITKNISRETEKISPQELKQLNNFINNFT